MSERYSARCKLCGADAKFICTTNNEHGRLQTIFNCRCLRCGVVFVSNELQDTDLFEAYATQDASAYHDETRTEGMRKLTRAADALAAMGASKGDHILDIGAGLGEFSVLLSERGYTSLAAHELPGADLSRVQRLGISVYQDCDWSSLPSAEFHYITMLDVAEHVRDPHLLFRQCFRVLCPGGTLYLHTPVVTGLDRLMHLTTALPVISRVGRAWQRGRTSIFHLQNYTLFALRELLANTGFQEIAASKRNELSWPLERYVQVFLCEKQHMPPAFVPILKPLLYPFLKTSFFNANKAVVRATKPL